MTQAPLRTLKTADALERAGLIASGDGAAIATVVEQYAVAITPLVASLIEPGRPDDPIALQFVPDIRELAPDAAELDDPIGDRAHEPVPGIVHRYHNRVLLKLVHACPVYCRFCFRRAMIGPGGEAPLAGKTLATALDYIRAHGEIREVILTGGDPFIVTPEAARRVREALEAIAHVKVMRWHTRVPIVDPARVSTEFVSAIAAAQKTVYAVVHVNHARELSPEALEALARLRAAGISLLSQSVLLRGVNDDAATLADLMWALTELHVKPYHLHQMDLAPGTAHFRVPLARAREIVEELRRLVSGLAMPNFVIDIPGGHGKVPAARERVIETSGTFTLIDDAGGAHTYPTTAR